MKTPQRYNQNSRWRLFFNKSLEKNLPSETYQGEGMNNYFRRCLAISKCDRDKWYMCRGSCLKKRRKKEGATLLLIEKDEACEI